jgi:hypothetical protein
LSFQKGLVLLFDELGFTVGKISIHGFNHTFFNSFAERCFQFKVLLATRADDLPAWDRDDGI